MLVGRLVNRNEWLWCKEVWWVWSVTSSVVWLGLSPCAFSPLAFRPLLVSTPIMIHPHHQHVAHTQPFVDVISIQVLAGGPPVSGREPSSRFVTSHLALYCPDVVCVCVCVCVCVRARARACVCGVREHMSLCAQQASPKLKDERPQTSNLLTHSNACLTM